jgi:hypothetical protein
VWLITICYLILDAETHRQQCRVSGMWSRSYFSLIVSAFSQSMSSSDILVFPACRRQLHCFPNSTSSRQSVIIQIRYALASNPVNFETKYFVILKHAGFRHLLSDSVQSKLQCILCGPLRSRNDDCLLIHRVIATFYLYSVLLVAASFRSVLTI